jgi:hypothetical protein
MRTLNIWSIGTTAAAAAVMASTPTSHAAINNYALFRVASFTQNSTAAPTTADDYFFSDRAFVDSASDFDSASLAYPGPGTPATLDLIPDPVSPFFNYGSPSVSTQAALDAAFPAGTYSTTATNSITSATQTVSVDVTNLNVFSHTIPALTPAGYTAIQGLHASADTTLSFNTFLPDAAANESDIFFTLFDTSGNSVFDAGFLPSSTTGITIPANTLQPNTPYTYTLIFSDRINSTDPNGLFDDLGYDLSTSGAFTTEPAPEPATLSLLSVAGLTLLLKRRR